jgi:hypothetical protein
MIQSASEHICRFFVNNTFYNKHLSICERKESWSHAPWDDCNIKLRGRRDKGEWWKG